MKLYIVTRNCCLGPCCSHVHLPNKPIRVEQLRTLKKANAEKCQRSFDAAGYNAKLIIKEIQEQDAELELQYDR